MLGYLSSSAVLLCVGTETDSTDVASVAVVTVAASVMVPIATHLGRRGNVAVAGDSTCLGAISGSRVNEGRALPGCMASLSAASTRWPRVSGVTKRTARGHV